MMMKLEWQLYHFPLMIHIFSLSAVCCYMCDIVMFYILLAIQTTHFAYFIFALSEECIQRSLSAKMDSYYTLCEISFEVIGCSTFFLFLILIVSLIILCEIYSIELLNPYVCRWISREKVCLMPFMFCASVFRMTIFFIIYIAIRLVSFMIHQTKIACYCVVVVSFWMSVSFC